MHHNICRRRTLVAIGTHDLDTLCPPFTYEARDPADIRFRPLGEDREFGATELLAHYAKDSKMSKFAAILAGAHKYPCLCAPARAPALASARGARACAPRLRLRPLTPTALPPRLASAVRSRAAQL